MKSSNRLRIAVGATFGCLLLTGAAPALAAGNPSSTGQPSQTCLSGAAPMEPGHAASAPGSAFNENGGIAGGMYAGSQPQNSNNPKSVSQYDVACYQVSQH
jgi:hypothetical protein